MSPIHFVNGWSPVIADLYQALGLDPAYVKSFTLHASIDSIVSAEVKYFVEADGIKGATEVAKKYHLGLVEVVTKEPEPEPKPTKSIPPKPDPPKTREVVRGLFSFWPW